LIGRAAESIVTAMLHLALTLLLLASSADARIDRILREVPLIDGHNDLPFQYAERAKNHLAQIDVSKDQRALAPPLHTDIPRLRAGKVGGVFWSVYVPTSHKGADAVRATLEQIDVVHRLDEQHRDVFELALNADDIVRIHRNRKIASLIGVEGGHSIGNSLAVLRQLHAAGARYMTITHSAHTDWADSAAGEPVHGGLTAFGREVIAEMNRLGMLVDLSHVSPATMHDALDVSLAPVIFSHSSARALTEHPRNVPDDVLRRLKDNGGVIMVSWVPEFSATKDATLQHVADHIDHAVRVAGAAHVGIGTDLDGIPTTPAGLASVADFPSLFAELIRRGYTDEQLKGIAGLNVLRVMRRAEAVSARLRKARPPSDVRIEELP
jgi:membrane dipeptidase